MVGGSVQRPASSVQRAPHPPPGCRFCSGLSTLDSGLFSKQQRGPIQQWTVGALAFLAALLLLAQATLADDLKLQASVDQTRVAVGEVVTLTVTLSAEGLSSPPTPVLPTPDGFEAEGTTSSSSTSISIANGRMTTTRTVSFVYTLRARREGSFVIGPARVDYEGKSYASSPIRVEVVKASGRRQTRPAPSSGGGLSRADLREIEENLFLQARPDRRSVYVGQEVEVTYKLFMNYNLQNVRYGHLPTYTGFWAEARYDANRLDLKREVVDGREFRAALLRRVALFPTSAGKHDLEQLEIVCDIAVQSQRRNLFDFDNFFSAPFRTRQVTVRSEALELEVRPLPPGAPAGFSGAVGRFQISAQASPAAVTAGDPVTVRVNVSGIGNIKGVAEPVRPSGSGFRFYDPKVSVETGDRGGRLGGEKTFEYVLIPEQAGEQAIPPFRLVYFDPDQARYAVVETAPMPLTVTPGAQPSRVEAAPLLSREEVRALGEDIRYIKPDMAVLEDQGTPIYRSRAFLWLQLLPSLGFLGAWLYRRHQDRLAGDVAYARRRRSRPEARRRLADARRLMTSGEGAAFHSEMHRALAQFLADRLNLPAAGMTGDSAAKALAERGAEKELTGQVIGVFQQCDFARFAPGQISGSEMENLYEAAEGLIDRLGREI